MSDGRNERARARLKPVLQTEQSRLQIIERLEKEKADLIAYNARVRDALGCKPDENIFEVIARLKR